MRASVIVVLALLLSACTASQEGSPPTQTVIAQSIVTVTVTPTPGPTGPDRATTVMSTASCSELDPVDFQDIPGSDGYVMTTRFGCDTTSSDQRISGHEEFTMVATILDPTVGGACIIDDAVLSTDQGTWRGSGRCMVDLAGVLSPAKYVEPTYFGDVAYVGEGAYSGLEYHYYLYGMQGEIAHAGWIAESG
ncbi:MAG: hypothetical protein HGA51_01550 [Demequinaceae bacterium]|nr:hypothetical protein [Demequinaceae bacterium]